MSDVKGLDDPAAGVERSAIRPAVLSGAVTVLYRNVQSPRDEGLLAYEFLVTRQRHGRRTGEIQVYQGGHVDAVDADVMAAAVREVREELGFDIEGRTHFVGVTGPRVLKSRMRLDGRTIILDVGSETLPISGAYVTSVFAADVTGQTQMPIEDSEVEVLGWMTLEEMISQYGEDPYFVRWGGVYAVVGFICDPDYTPYVLGYSSDEFPIGF